MEFTCIKLQEELFVQVIVQHNTTKIQIPENVNRVIQLVILAVIAIITLANHATMDTTSTTLLVYLNVQVAIIQTVLILFAILAHLIV